MPSSNPALRLRAIRGLTVLAVAAVPVAVAPSAHAATQAPKAWFDCSGVTSSSPETSTTVVDDIRVNRCLSGTVEHLVNQARSEGVNLAGNGWRDVKQQEALRAQNCGGSDHDSVWNKPADQCHPATALPGRSMHERGLAVDFTVNGSTIKDGSAEFKWLSDHAADYGFHNLPAEPWHWSITGG